MVSFPRDEERYDAFDAPELGLARTRIGVGKVGRSYGLTVRLMALGFGSWVRFRS